MTDLRAAIEAADWPHALPLALAVWRTTRSPVYADLVERIARHTPDEPPLLLHLAKLGRRLTERQLFDALSRVRATAENDDPRVAKQLAAWFATASIGWRYAHETETMWFYQELADQLVQLRDVRVIPTIERVLGEPHGKTLPLREHQRALATRIVDALADVALHTPPLANAGEIARWCPSPAAPVVTQDERALWREAAASDDARLVLADFLLDRGDRRGEIISLSLARTDDTTARASRLLAEHWDRWMGELALVFDRGTCTFTGGVLDVATVGIYSTPEWAYAKAAAHCELATVRIVRPGWNASDKGYVAFLHALAELPPRIRLTATMIEPLSLARSRWPITHLELVTNLPDLRTPLVDALALAASAMPDVETLDFPIPGELDIRVVDAIRELPQLFDKLARVRVDAARWLAPALRTALQQLDELPFVEVDHGSYGLRGGAAND